MTQCGLCSEDQKLPLPGSRDSQPQILKCECTQGPQSLEYREPPQLPLLDIALAIAHGLAIVLLFCSIFSRCRSFPSSTGLRLFVLDNTLEIFSGLSQPHFALCRLTLPTTIEAQYPVYNNLETSESRILLPSKVRQFPILEADAAAASGTPQPELLPECVGIHQVCV